MWTEDLNPQTNDITKGKVSTGQDVCTVLFVFVCVCNVAWWRGKTHQYLNISTDCTNVPWRWAKTAFLGLLKDKSILYFLSYTIKIKLLKNVDKTYTNVLYTWVWNRLTRGHGQEYNNQESTGCAPLSAWNHATANTFAPSYWPKSHKRDSPQAQDTLL